MKIARSAGGCMNHAVAAVFEAFEHVQYTACQGVGTCTALTVRLFAVWSS